MEVPEKLIRDLKIDKKENESEEAYNERLNGEIHNQLIQILMANYRGEIDFTLHDISPISRPSLDDLRINPVKRDIYGIQARMEMKNTGQIARKGLILKKSDKFSLEKRVGLISNDFPASEEYIFSSDKRPIQAFARYLTGPGIGPLFDATTLNLFEKNGYTLTEEVDNVDLVRKINNTGKIRLMDVAGAFDPLIILHERVASKYLDEIAFLTGKKKQEDYLGEIMDGMYRLYRDIPNKNEIADNLLTLINKYFMPDELQTVIHNTTPQHNLMISLINPSHVTVGPRTIDIGAVIGWPEIFGRFYDPSFIAQNAIEEGYLWRKERIFKQFQLKGKDPDPVSLEEGTYFGSIYMIYREATKMRLDKNLLQSTILKQLDVLASKDVREAGELQKYISSYKTVKKE